MCAEGGAIVQQLAKRISEEGGAALIADYGHDGTKTDTFRVRTLSSTLLLLLSRLLFVFFLSWLLTRGSKVTSSMTS